MEGPVLSIQARPSRRLFRLLQFLHFMALLAPWASALPAALAVAGSLFALLGLARLRRAWRDDAGGWRIDVHGARWTLGERGVASAAELLGESVVWPVFVVLRLRVEGRVRALVLMEDSCTRDEFRRLRVAARMSARLSNGSAD